LGRLVLTAYIIGGQIYVNDNYGLVSASAAATGFYPHSTEGLLFKIAGSEKMRITSGGNVGIGTTSPGAKLNIAHTASTTIPALQVASSASLASNDIVRFQINGLTNGFRMFQDASSVLNYTFQDGNVGIGTTSPVTKLNLKESNTGTEGLIITNWNNVNTLFLGSDSSSGGGKITLKTNAGTSNVFISSYSDSYLNGGNVGIGTTDPTSQMSSTFGIGIYNALYPAVGFKNSTTAWLWYGQDSTFRMWNVTFGDILTANTSGNIGIGTGSPSTKLDVNGVITATGGTSTQWNTAYGWGNHASQGYATQTYVNTAVSNLVDTAPSTLDTLNELAAALGDDPNFATTVTNSIAGKLSLAGGTLTGGLSGTTATFTTNGSSIITLTSAGTNASMIKAGAGDELYLGGNDNWQMRFNSGNVLMDNGGYLQNDQSLRAPIFYDSANTAYYLDPNSTSVLSSADFSNGIVDNANTRIFMPGGASSVGNSSGTGGAIRINLPIATYGVNTMMSMTIQVYEYSTGQSFTIRCGGYNYYTHDWYNVFAYLLNDSGKGSDVPVYFGNDGTRDVIWIGNPDWSWSYPNVFVTDFQAGHSQYSNWKTGWSISFDTSARTNVSASRTAYRQIDTGTISLQSVSYATTAGSLTSMNISQFTNNSGYLTSYTDTNTTYTAGTGLALTGTVFSNTITNNNQLTNGAGYTTNTGTTTGSGTTNYISKWSGTTSQANSLIYDNGTNVGIGTTSPTEKLQVEGKIVLGANPSWGKSLILGGNANNSTANAASIGVTNGNLHIDAAVGASATYLNYYDGTAGVAFGNGATGLVAWMGPDGDLWKGTSDNTGQKYWNAGDGSATNWNTAYGWGNHASQGYATQTYVNTAVSNLVAAAPGTLDTLNELAAALGDDPNFATTVTNSIAGKLSLAGGTMTGDIIFNNNIRLEYSTTHWITPRDSGGNMHLHTATGGIYLDAPVIYFRERGSEGNSITVDNGTLTATGIITATGGNSTNWNTAYGWGNHASAGYITGYTETDTLATVTNRGNSTSQNLVFSNGRKGLVGVYDAAQTQAIFAMGASYVLTDGGGSGTIGNHYGLAWSYNPNYGGSGNNPQSKAGLEHQLLVMNAGITRTALGVGIWTSGLITTTSYGTSANWNTAYGWGNHAGLYAAASHTHTIANVTGLQAALDGKQAAGTYLTSLGFSYSTGVTANHVVQRDANGYIYANHINFSTGETENPTISSFFVSNGDGWSRKASIAHVKGQLGLGSAAYVATSTFAAAAHDHDRSFITDSRGSSRAPSYYDQRYAQWDFQNTSDTGAGGDGWHGLLTVAKWSSWDASHRQEQLLFTGNDLKRRTATYKRCRVYY
jgi:hypothetical protein